MSRLDDRLAALATMSSAELRTAWQRAYRSPPPRISNDLLIRAIAWQLQASALGGLSPSVQRELRDAVGAGSSPASSRPSRDPIRPGTRLLRTWGGRSWSVTVVEDGYVFEGRQYPSLSQIAREITGAHWSGPRFFGLRGTKARTVTSSGGVSRDA